MQDYRIVIFEARDYSQSNNSIGEDKKGYFHTWINAGEYNAVAGIVEDEDGNIYVLSPDKIKFTKELSTPKKI